MLVQIEPGLIIWTIVTFVLLMFILGKWGWGPIIRALEVRENRIRDTLEEGERAREEAQRLREEYDGLIAKAESESREIIQAGREVSEQMRREAEAQAREETREMLEHAHLVIQNAKETALREIRDVVADLATQAAGRIVQENLDKERNRKIVDDLIEQIER